MCRSTCVDCARPMNATSLAHLCACCERPVCPSCREEIGGMNHCAVCAGLARDFINAPEAPRAPQVPTNDQEQLPLPW